jgi:hypothetical protein
MRLSTGTGSEVLIVSEVDGFSIMVEPFSFCSINSSSPNSKRCIISSLEMVLETCCLSTTLAALLQGLLLSPINTQHELISNKDGALSTRYKRMTWITKTENSKPEEEKCKITWRLYIFSSIVQCAIRR